MAPKNPNPFRVLRLKQGLSQYQLADRAGVSKHAVLRLEQGMYDKPLPSLIDYFLDTDTLPYQTLIQEYSDFQIATREANPRLLGDIAFLLTQCPVGTHPLTYLRLRNKLNPTELAKRLCISQTIIVHFEKRSIHQHTVPQQLLEALQDADYSEVEIDLFKKSYAEYRQHVLDSRELRLVPSPLPVGQSPSDLDEGPVAQCL